MVTDICYDTEFVENGHTIRLLSIGMVTPFTGDTLYLISNDQPTMDAAVNNEWLRENVVPSLPVIVSPPGAKGYMSDTRWTWEWDTHDPDRQFVVNRGYIAKEVARFITSFGDPVLWADYGSYDHVVLNQLWGRMIDHPQGVPMWTADLRQEIMRLGSPDVPELGGMRAHNALDDAREAAYRLSWLRSFELTMRHHGVAPHIGLAPYREGSEDGEAAALAALGPARRKGTGR